MSTNNYYGVVYLNKNLIEELTGSNHYYYMDCELNMTKNEVEKYIDNANIVKLENIDLNNLKNHGIKIRRSNTHNPGFFDIIELINF